MFQDQRGFTAVETTIILIAFVTLAAMFGFAVMSTGILASERSKGVAFGGLQRATATLVLRGSVVGESNSDHTAIDRVSFDLVAVARGTQGIFLSPDNTIVTFVDEDQAVHLSEEQWGAEWLTGFGPLVNDGELVRVSLDLTSLTPKLMASRRFTVRVIPDVGGAMTISRSVPRELSEFVDLP